MTHHFNVRDYSHLGVNNLNHLVTQQLGHSGFEVVRHVHDSIEWLYFLYQQIPQLNAIQQSFPYFEMLSKHLHSVELLASHLNSIESLNGNISLVQDLAPRIQAFKESLDKYQTALKENSDKVDVLQRLYDEAEMDIRNLVFNTEQAFQKALDTMKANIQTEVANVLCDSKKFHETVKKQYGELEANRDILKSYLSTASENHKMLKHLMASDAVNTYLWEQTEAYKQEAMNAIKASEKVGNNEVTNRHKMKATKSNLNLFKVLNRNNLELANKNVAKQVQQKQEMCNG